MTRRTESISLQSGGPELPVTRSFLVEAVTSPAEVEIDPQ
jgi:hypothetical protein